MKKIIILAAGNIALILGLVGIFLPVLPTTPFLLLAASCYMKSSEKLYFWLTNHRVLGCYIKSYIEYKAITYKAKVISLVSLWSVMMMTIFFFINPVWLKVLLVFIAIGVTIFLVHIKTLTDEMIKSLNQSTS